MAPMNTGMPLPKYHQIYLVLREQLQEGRFDGGMPGELALMSQFGVARVTIRRALAQLTQEGLIERMPGRGTRPVRHADRHDAGQGAAAAANGQTARLTGLLENLVTMAPWQSQMLDFDGLNRVIETPQLLQQGQSYAG